MHANKRLVCAAVSMACAFGFAQSALSATLAEAVDRTIKTNPEILIDASQKLATDQAVKEAQGGYFPKVDLNSGIGREWSENTTTRNRPGGDDTLTRREAGLSLTQLIYDGSATISEVERQKSRSNAAAHKVMGTSEQIGLKAIEAYLNVLRREELLKLAQINLTAHEKTFEQIKLRSDTGVARKADLEQASARLYLSQANTISAEANLREANIAYNRVVGVMPDTLTKPEAVATPASVDEALRVAIEQNPVLKSAMSDIEAAQAQQRAAGSLMKPRVHLDVGVNANMDMDGVDFKDNDRYAMIRMNYNLFHGGADAARIAQTSIQTQESIDTKNRTERQLEESTRLSYNSWVTSQERLPKLKATVDAAERTRDAYQKQFSIGQRTLLDLLDSENEVYTDRSNLVDTEYVDLFARYRLLADMGSLLQALGIAPREEATVTYANAAPAAAAENPAPAEEAEPMAPEAASPEKAE